MPIQQLNETTLALAYVPTRVRRDGFDLTTIVKGRFRLVAGAPCAPLERPLLSGDEPFDDDAPSSLRIASDFAPFKPKADVTLVGTCRAPTGKQLRMQRVTLSLGPLRKAIVVRGDRQFIEGVDRRLVPSEPAPFEAMPLRYERAFGGPGFAANPVGIGHDPGADARGRPVPNLELFGTAIVAPSDRAASAALGPVPIDWSPRSDRTGTYDAAWLAKNWPYFPDDFDVSTFNASPVDQRVPYLAGDEALTIEGLFGDTPSVTTTLPALRPRCFYRVARLDASHVEEVPLVLDTAHVDTDTLELVLVWRGRFPIASREADEVRQALLVVEPLSEPAQPASTYAGDGFWAPAAPDEAEVEAAPPPLAEATPPSAARLEIDPEEQRFLDEARDDLRTSGADPALLARLEGVTTSAAFAAILVANLPVPECADTGDVAPANDNPAEPEGKPLSASERRAKARAEERAELAKECAELRAAGADPKLVAEAERAETRQGLLRALLGGLPPPRSDEERAEREELLRAIDRDEHAARERELAEEATERSVRGERLTRDEVLALHAQGGSLAGANLTGLELAGADLRGAKLANAKLERANLAGANLTGSDLAGASLRLADLRGATLDEAVATEADLAGANLTNASLVRATLAGARLGEVDLSRSILTEADLTGAVLTGATLAGARLDAATLDGARLERANLQGASLAKSLLHSANLDDAHLVQARLDGAVVQGASLARTILDEASLAEAHLEGVTGEGASFQGAKLTGLRAAGAKLPGARLARVDATGSQWTGADLTGADLTDAVLVKANLTEASLTGARLHRARLEEAIATRANLAAAQLTKTNLLRARLTGAVLTGADVRSSNLFECDLFEASLERARLEGSNLGRTHLDARRTS